MSLDVCLIKVMPTRIYEAGITHNLHEMAMEAGIYKHLWEPEEVDCTKAQDLIKPLAIGLTLLTSDPDRFKKFNPPNKWGNYDGLVSFVEKYLEACKADPDATIEISR